MQPAQKSRFNRFLSSISWDFVILCFGLLLSIGLWKLTQIIVDEQQKSLLQVELSDKNNIIQRRLDRYTELLYSIRGLYGASVLVEKDEFEAFVDSLDVFNKFPGLYAITFVKNVKNNELENFFSTYLPEVGIEGGFKIFPISAHGEFYPVTFAKLIRPLKVSIIGFDLSSEPQRLAVLSQARDNNKIVSTSQIDILPQEETDLPGFLMTIPIYKNGLPSESINDRRENLDGFVNAVFSYKDLLEPIFPLLNLPETASFNLYDGDELIYSSKAQNESLDRSSSYTENLTVANRVWRLEFIGLSQPAKNSLLAQMPLMVFIGGIISTFLVFSILYMLSTSKQHAQELALQMTADLDKFKLAFESATNSIVITDPDAKVLYANKAVSQVTGYDMDEILGNKTSLWGGLMGKEFYQKMWAQIKTQKLPFTQELTNRKKNGDRFDVILNISPILNEKGEILGFVGVEEDITKRKSDEQNLARKSDELVRINKLMVGRENRMTDLKIQIKKLEEQLRHREGGDIHGSNTKT